MATLVCYWCRGTVAAGTCLDRCEESLRRFHRRRCSDCDVAVGPRDSSEENRVSMHGAPGEWQRLWQCVCWDHYTGAPLRRPIETTTVLVIAFKTPGGADKLHIRRLLHDWMTERLTGREHRPPELAAMRITIGNARDFKPKES